MSFSPKLMDINQLHLYVASNSEWKVDGLQSQKPALAMASQLIS